MKVRIALEPEVDGRWIAAVRQFGVLLYGQTPRNAVNRAVRSVRLLLADRVEHCEERAPSALTFTVRVVMPRNSTAEERFLAVEAIREATYALQHGGRELPRLAKVHRIVKLAVEPEHRTRKRRPVVITGVDDPELLRLLRERQRGPLIPWQDVEVEFLDSRKRAKRTRRR